MVKNYITKIGFETLRAEAAHLLKVERPATVKTVAWAASNGDRSENGDYIYGKRRLREIDSRVRHLIKRIDAAEVVDTSTLKSKSVIFGALVEIEYEDGAKKLCQIVGEDEIDPKQNKISWKSPMATALLGKKIDDEVSVKTPKGTAWVTILDIRFT
jgi:transcription elongation factor GreB